MLKRANKITALLAAVATVATMAPTVASAESTKRLGTEKGEFKQAFSYGEGKYVYDGYKDDEETAIYFHEGDKDEEVEDYEDYDFDEAEKYGKKYITVEDDGDVYLLDLSTGKIDDESLEDKEDNVKSRLKTDLKKADRYEVFKDNKEDVDSEGNTFERVLKNKYGEVWYKYQVTGDKEASDSMADGVTKYIGVVNEDKKYLDLSNVANISIYSQSKGKTVKFDEFGSSEDFYKDGKDTKEATLKLVDLKIIAQDDDNLYAITSVKLEGEETEKKEEVEEVNASATEESAELKAAKEELAAAQAELATAQAELTAAGEDEDAKKAAQAKVDAAQAKVDAAQAKVDAAQAEKPAEEPAEKPANKDEGVQYFLQKISKAQGDKKDGAYVPKKVESYQIDYDKVYKDGDVKDAAEQLLKLLDQDDDKDKFDEGDVINVQVKDSVIHVAVLDDSDTVKVYKLKYKKDKVDAYTGEKNSNGKDEVKEKVDAPVVYKDGDTDEDIVDVKDDDDAKPYSIDVDGNLWILGKGKIYQYDDGKFEQLYTCDRSINNLDVYDKENLIAWEKDEESYAVVTGGKIVDDNGNEEEPDDTTKTDKVGWDKNEDGTWSFYDATGVQVKASWVNVQGVWYYLKADGIMATGWLQEGGNWYYLNASGAMQTGWVNDNGTWYYLNASGAMAYGWLQDTDGRWYYLSTTSGAMLTNTTVDGYYLGANGAWVK